MYCFIQVFLLRCRPYHFQQMRAANSDFATLLVLNTTYNHCLLAAHIGSKWSIKNMVYTFITNLLNNTFSSVKFTRGNEKNMSFLLISKSQVVWKKNTIGLSFKCMNVIWMTPLTLLDHLPLSRSFLFPVLHCSESMLCVMLLLLLALLFFVFSLLFIYILSSKCSKH